ncbi:hypothetical protein [Peribacillus butanolivorans]|uniref:hypothetical protein n=1 Tax=Peribacillus butanolivorans TaxID=421767 RepID=UPI0035D5A2C0
MKLEKFTSRPSEFVKTTENRNEYMYVEAKLHFRTLILKEYSTSETGLTAGQSRLAKT